MAKIRMAIHPDDDAHYSSMGLTRGIVEPWEDGMRTDGSRGTYEWWYFDSRYPDGTILVIFFFSKSPIQVNGPIKPTATMELTLPDGRHKKTYSSRGAWARVAFLDPAYTESVGRDGTISTALDAMAHAMESYLSPKSNDLSRMLSLYAGRAIWDVLSEYPDTFTPDMRDALACASCAAGAAISITGTGFPHPLGYSLTLLDDIPHGRACAVFHGDYIEYNRRTPEGAALIDAFAAGIGTKPSLLAEYLPSLAAVRLHFTDAEIAERVSLISNAKNYTNSPYVLSDEEKTEIYRKHFGGKNA